MTNNERKAILEQLNQIHSELLMLGRNNKRINRSSSEFQHIKTMHEMIIENSPELTQSIILKYPYLFQQIKVLKQSNDIEKTIECLMLITPEDAI